MSTILQATQRYYLEGGSDRMFFDTVDLLEREGHEVIPFAATDARNEPTSWEAWFPEAASFERPGALDLLRYHYSLPARRALNRLLHGRHIDIAHLHITYGKLTTSILDPLRRAGIPIVQTLHEYKPICPVYTLVSNGTICEACRGGHFWRALPRRCNRSSLARTALSVSESYLSRWLGAIDKIDHFIAVSEFQRRKMIEHGLPEARISTVHNFVDTDGRLPGTGTGDYLLYFGRLERLKGVFTLLDAVRGSALPLRLVGDGSATEEVRARLREPGFERVELLGFQRGAALRELIRGCVATVVPSEWYEPFGLTVIESFAHGRPVIASRIGGIAELVRPGEDGWLFEPGDTVALRHQLEEAFGDRERSARMGLTARERAVRDFGPNRYYRDLLAVYRRLGGATQPEPPTFGSTEGAGR